MRVILMGGAGEMGSRAAEDLASSPDVQQLTLADRNIAAAGAWADELKARGANVDALQVDARNHAQLVSAMRGYDVAASALGPFYEFEARLVRAAIEAGVDYASICDEFDAAQAVFSEFAQKAADSGRIILTGLGASPGMTNVAAALLARQMDSVNRVDIYCYQPLDAGGGEAVVRHMLHIMTGQVPVFRNGQHVPINALTESGDVEFPRYGKIRLWNMGHSEPITIPRFIPGVKEVNFQMGYGQGANWLIVPAKWGLFSSQSRLTIAAKFLKWLDARMKPNQPGWGALRIDVWGTKDGRVEHKLVCGVGEMREATGLSLSVGTLMLARRQLTTTTAGLYAPEGILDPVAFIAELRARKVEAFYDLEMKSPL